MKLKYIPILGAFLLTSCSFSSYWSQDSVPLSGGTSQTGIQAQTGSTIPSKIIAIEPNETKDIPVTLTDGKGSATFYSGTGARANIRFNSEGTKSLMVTVETPKDPKGNVRISQIILPDGMADGPFGRELTYNLTQSGSHQIVLSANMMAGDPWAGEVRVNIDLK